MKIDVRTKDGGTAGSIELSDEIFGIEPNEHAMYLAVKAYLANRRHGTHKTKTRSEVSGGGRKPFRQKGTGGARRGSNRSPLMPGGGTIHGPFPHGYALDIPIKVKRLARKSALSARMRENSLMIIEDFTTEQGKTKEFVTVLKALELNGTKVLVLLPEPIEPVIRSARNLPGVTTFPADKVSTYDVLNHKSLLIFRSALPALERSFGIAQ